MHATIKTFENNITDPIALSACVVYQENASLLVFISVSHRGEFLFLGNSVCEMTIYYKHSIINGDCKTYCNPDGFSLGKCVLVVTKGGLPNWAGIRLLLQNKTPQPLLW
ncbi:uncharacterized protein LOC118733701 [Rhagoletis pomonella]|uniref:uncharacterized protein LOC118733701 n=1 Tax=Rhagoletis pomonella TaxID=28610 RepID=UPI00177EA08F|nr:uncharacterized protein LOC118733701 [Rhagoletis pomonella]